MIKINKEKKVVDIFSVANFVIAGIISIAIIFIAFTLEYGVFSSGDSELDIREGVFSGRFFIIPLLIGLFVYLTAGIGIRKRKMWGYYAHIAGAIIAFFTLVLCAYTIISLIYASESEFKNEFHR